MVAFLPDKLMFKNIILAVASILLLTLVSYAQVPKQCESMKYQDHNKTQPAQKLVKTITGTVKLLDNEHIRVSSCVAVYEEATKKLVRVMFLNLKQRFDIKEIPDGEYRIVVKEKDGYFCTSNLPVKVDASIVEKADIAIEIKRPNEGDCKYEDIKP
jgi:hypothetical protein